MSGRYLLDTNIVIALLEGEKVVLEALTNINELFLSSIVLGELYYGAFKSKRPLDNVARIVELTDSVAIISCDHSVAQRYGEVKNGLSNKGRPIPENDVWIAATAISHELTLVTRDRHFEFVAGLHSEAW